MSSEYVARQGLIHSTWKVRHLGISNYSPCQLRKIEGMNSTSFTWARLPFLFCLENYSGQKDPVFSKRAFFPTVVLKFDISQVCITDPVCSAPELYV